MTARANLIEWIRGEIVGPFCPIGQVTQVQFSDRQLVESLPFQHGPMVWKSDQDGAMHEVLAFRGETPHRKYGAGLLHPECDADSERSEGDVAAERSDTIGADAADESLADNGGGLIDDDSNEEQAAAQGSGDGSQVFGEADETDDFEVVSHDIRHPSTIGISFCVALEDTGHLVIRLPLQRRFAWQSQNAQPIQLNGRYEECRGSWTDDERRGGERPAWRRQPGVTADCVIEVQCSELINRRKIERPVDVPSGCPLDLYCQIFPRKLGASGGGWLITVVLRNGTRTSTRRESREATLYQSFFEISVSDGVFQKYPEGTRPFAQLDEDEKSLALLYRESATWGIGHGCAAGWDAEPNQRPLTVYADVMPAVELPSMTPDIEIDGRPVRISMSELVGLSEDGEGAAWSLLESLCNGFSDWILRRHADVPELSNELAEVAKAHLVGCKDCLLRMRSGLARLRTDERGRRAFRLANLAMLLQQIATKQLRRRGLSWDESRQCVVPEGDCISPWNVFESTSWNEDRLGSWRAFQIAFLLMSLDGVSDGSSHDREIVDLVWFPTGGGKTEAYLGVMAYYMFYQRLSMESEDHGPARDGTNALMRYTLRMLTTQQFQRAASLICAMEYLRRHPRRHQICSIPGKRFSLGLWIGREGSPNDIDGAREKLREFRRSNNKSDGNPLVITECPWCRAEIGRLNVSMPHTRPALTERQWNGMRVRGIRDDRARGPLLVCPDPACEFGKEQVETWLPIEVIDKRIYEQPPSLVISTADKLAMIAYKPQACGLFGRQFVGGETRSESLPPGLIIQDELHLISGPLGTMYALYEGIVERLCSFQKDDVWIKPKLIASTATIRGAAEQVNSLYCRNRTQLFPSPGLSMGDSFFGRYARDAEGRLASGRLYLGIHASDYGSILTAQVRAFSSALFLPWTLPEASRDPWWTLLAFYNSIRELSGARTLFDSDIRSRLKFLFNRETFEADKRRNLQIVEELTSRLSQAGIVKMMDDLAIPYSRANSRKVIDACLASSIIEVGVDIDRLSLMGVVGQPKTTATYIQVTGRVGRQWWERPGLVLMIYNPSKSRDRSHFEQFHSYHRRLYERVEPTTATPFAVSAIQRGLSGALIAWVRQHRNAGVSNSQAYAVLVESGFQLLRERCEQIQKPEDQERSLAELARVRDQLRRKWALNPQEWEEFPPQVDGEYLMLWPGQYATPLQKQRGVVVPSSMRQVDGSAELYITRGYAIESSADQ